MNNSLSRLSIVALAISASFFVASANAGTRQPPAQHSQQLSQQQQQGLQKHKPVIVDRQVQTTHNEDGSVTRNISGTTRKGEAVNSTITSQRDENGGSIDRSITVGDRSASSHTDISRDAASGTTARTTTGTNLQGEAISGSTTVVRTDDGVVRDSSFTNGNGKTSTVHGEMQRNDDGSWSRTQTTTGPNGGQRVVTASGDGQGNRSREVEVTPPPKP